jgi:Predicted branched-chain amino acid permeases (azaleucine resistance)
VTLTAAQTLIIVAMVALATIITRFLPFLIFRKSENSGDQNTYLNYFGKVLPYASVGLLVVYCLKGVSLTGPSHGIPEAIAILCTALLHFWKGNSLLSIGAGTAIYMVLVQVVFK